MARTRTRSRRSAALAFDALTVEGSLIAPAMLARIAQHQAGGQSEADYGIPKGLTLRDEIARYFRIGQALFRELTASPTPSHAATVGFVEKLLTMVLGFTDLQRVGQRTVGERTFTLTLEALGGRVPIVIVPPGEDLDRPSDCLATDGRRRSAAFALQDWLNANDGALWGLASNGLRLRLIRDNASFTRPAYVEADLARVFEGEDFADFTALWLLLHASRFGPAGAQPSDCPLERWREAGQKDGVTARDKLRGGVEAALLSLGNGFLAHPDNASLRERIATGALPLPQYFGQLLRLVYRLIFLLAAEDRNLLHPPSASAAQRKLYAGGYSLALLRDRAVRRSAWDRHHDRWEGLGVTFRALARGEPRLGLPALDGLFARGTMPDLREARLANRSLMEAIRHLAWLEEDAVLAPVNWRDMETEELGSVYESLLELTPQLTDDGRGIKFAEGGEGKGHARKTTGSYYTPDSLVQALLDSALDPVLDRVEAEASDPAAALLSVTVLDPACGSGHFLLAAARRIATRLARVRAGGNPAPADYRHALRDVARACIYGVDRNPMAVELTKVALWIETVEPGKPLGFLDANIRCGDSLFGVFDLKALEQGIPDAAFKPLAGDDKETAKHFEKRNKAERDGQGTLDFTGGGGKLPPRLPLAGEARALRAMPEDDPDQIAAKRKRFESARAEPGRWSLRVAADLYVAAFLTPKTGGVPENRGKVTIPTTAHVWDALAARTVYGPLVGAAQDLAAEARAFHWPLEFPDIMAAGGFDVVLGNPPWDQIQLDPREFFAAEAPEIAEAPNLAAREKLIRSLSTERPALLAKYNAAEHSMASYQAFVHESGRFPTSSFGRLNTAPLFVELVIDLVSARGRVGIIVPTGLATDSFSQYLFQKMVVGSRLVRLVSFENEEFIFPAVHHAFRFCLLVLGPEGICDKPLFSFFLRRPEQRNDAERNFALSKDDIALINPNTITAPVFRSRADAELTATIYARVPVLIDETKSPANNPWGVSFQLMFMMSTASGLFRTAADLRNAGYSPDGNAWVLSSGTRRSQPTLLSDGPPERYCPLYEGKLIHQFDHRWATYDNGDSRDVTPVEKAASNFELTPRYWIPEREVGARLAAKRWTRSWLMGWRDIARAADERTAIFAVIPRSAVGNTAPLVFLDAEPAMWAGLLGNLNSLVLDFIVRLKVGGAHLTFGYVKQLPILPPSAYTEADLAFIVPRVLELTYTSHSMAPFARDLGHDGPPFPWDEDRRALLRAELDAWYARAYGLTRDELRYILDPTDVKGPTYPSETFRVLKTNEIRKYGEYRTARLVLAAWDALNP